jgi:hypothetical protein
MLGNRLSEGHISCVAMLAGIRGKVNVGHPTEALGRALYNFSGGANEQGSCFACHD